MKNIKNKNVENIKLYSDKIIQIWKYTNIHVEKYKCPKSKRVCKESKYIYKKP